MSRESDHELALRIVLDAVERANREIYEAAERARKLLPDEATISARGGDWIQVYSGGQFWPLDPRVDEVHIEDIAHALSLICRFTGHVREFYSVAQHSVLVARAVMRWLDAATCDICTRRDPSTRQSPVVCRDVNDRYEMFCSRCLDAEDDGPLFAIIRPLDPRGRRRIALAGLLHDGSEAYICDMARPLKMLPAMAAYRRVEQLVQQCVYDAFGLFEEPRIVKRADNVLLATEARDLILTMHPAWSIKPPKWPTLAETIVPWSPAESERAFLETFKELSA